MSRAMVDGLQRNPDGRLVFWSQSRPAEITLKDLDRRGAEVAEALTARGLRQGDVIVVQLPNWVEGALVWYAANLLGLVTVPVVHIYGAAELEYIVRDAGAKALFLPDRWRSIDYLDRLRLMGDVEGLDLVVVVGDDVPAGAVPWTELVEGPRAAYPPSSASTDDPCIILYTSGTTSDPKGVAHSHDSLLSEMFTVHRFFGEQREVYFNPSPAGHITGLLGVTRPFLLSSPLSVFMDAWDARVGVELVNEYRATAVGSAPFFLSTLLDAAEAMAEEVPSMQRWMLGGAGVPAALVERADAAGIAGYRCYGSTEHPTVTSGLPSDSLDIRARTDGRPILGSEVRIVDDDGRDVPTGEEGEIVTIGPDQMIRYTDPVKDAESFLPDGWFLTGDVGVLDEAGCMTVTDRKKDIIIRGGENLSSQEIESVLSRHPLVVEAAAVAMPDERYGERVCAFVMLREGGALSLDDVREHFVAAGVARHKTPERVEVVADLPRTPSGKVRKGPLRDQLREEADSS